MKLTLRTRSCSSVVAFRFFRLSPRSALLAFFRFLLLRRRRSLSLLRISISSEADEDEDEPAGASDVPSSSSSVHEEEVEATDASEFRYQRIRCIHALSLIEILFQQFIGLSQLGVVIRWHLSSLEILRRFRIPKPHHLMSKRPASSQSEKTRRQRSRRKSLQHSKLTCFLMKDGFWICAVPLISYTRLTL